MSGSKNTRQTVDHGLPQKLTLPATSEFEHSECSGVVPSVELCFASMVPPWLQAVAANHHMFPIALHCDCIARNVAVAVCVFVFVCVWGEHAQA